jgi:alkylated DNA repair dioxygenase AlkB
MAQRSLFPAVAETFAKGYFHEEDFLSAAEEAGLVEQIRRLPLAQAEYKQFHAKRRVLSYGGRYDFSAQRLNDAEPIPEFLEPLRERIARWASRSATSFSHALIAEYAEGTRLGWHRDVPQFELVVGVSLLGPCRMRFRRYPPQHRERSIAVELLPRSIYRLEGEARWEWQHSIPSTRALRYSITFRTLRRRATADPA